MWLSICDTTKEKDSSYCVAKSHKKKHHARKRGLWALQERNSNLSLYYLRLKLDACFLGPFYPLQNGIYILITFNRIFLYHKINVFIKLIFSYYTLGPFYL